MKNSKQKSVSETVCDIDNPEVASENSATSEVRDVLSQILREGAQKMLQTAIQQEVDEYLQNRADIVGEDGRRLVIRNGSLPERELITGSGSQQQRTETDGPRHREVSCQSCRVA